ncbi:MAG: hypothetical protein HOE30_24740 [Deltaproteobacteria bacterium]|nr:hypothetical protein [Deltaproteobacteria bacterium]
MNKQFSNLEKKQKSIIKKGLSSILGLLLSINLAIAVPIDQEKAIITINRWISIKQLFLAYLKASWADCHFLQVS